MNYVASGNDSGLFWASVCCCGRLFWHRAFRLTFDGTLGRWLDADNWGRRTWYVPGTQGAHLGAFGRHGTLSRPMGCWPVPFDAVSRPVNFQRATLMAMFWLLSVSMESLPPVRDWLALAADEAKILTPYLRRGLKLFGPAYVFAILASLKDAVDQMRSEMPNGTNMKLYDEAAAHVTQARDMVQKLEQRGRAGGSGLLRMDDLANAEKKKP
jgi:hypothetical protein